MAESRETFVAGEGDAATVPTGAAAPVGSTGTSESTMRDMDRMLDETLASTEDRRAHIDVEHVDADATDDPEVTRTRIERTRARMSETIDEIEDALLRKKENLQEKLNVFSPVEKNPLPSVGIAFGAGLLLGFLTGGDEDDEHAVHGHGPRPQTVDDEFWSRRASDWEARARRLLELAQRQEVELSELRGRQPAGTAAAASAGAGAAGSTRSAYAGTPYGSSFTEGPGDTYQVDLEESGSDSDRWERISSPLRNIGDTVVEGLTGFLTRATRDLSGSGPRG